MPEGVQRHALGERGTGLFTPVRALHRHARTTVAAATAMTTYTIFADHEKVKRGWLPLLTGLSQQAAAEELVARQDVVRRNGQPCKFKVLADGETP